MNDGFCLSGNKALIRGTINFQYKRKRLLEHLILHIYMLICLITASRLIGSKNFLR